MPGQAECNLARTSDGGRGIESMAIVPPVEGEGPRPALLTKIVDAAADPNVRRGWLSAQASIDCIARGSKSPKVEPSQGRAQVHRILALAVHPAGD